MDKKRVIVALTVLDAVKTKYPETKQFIDNTMEEACQKEKVYVDEVIFFYKSRSKELVQENIFCFAVSMLRDTVLSYRL